MKKSLVACLLGFATLLASAQTAAFTCGGVGADDQQRIKDQAAQRGLLLTFASTTGAYLADIDVQIRQGTRVVLEGRCGGPLMLVDTIAPGTYQVNAVSNGRELRKNVVVGNGPAQLTFAWPAS